MFSRLALALLFTFELSAATFLHGAPGEPLQLPTYGISVLPPRGMTPVIETAPEEVAVWSRIDKGSNRIVEVIRIEILHSEGHELAQIAAESAKQAGGEVAKRGFRVDGMPALSCEFKNPSIPDGNDLATTAMFLTARAQLVYRATVQSALIGGNPRASDIQEVIEHWKWQPVLSPATRLELRQESTRVFGAFAVRLPAILREYPTDDPTTEKSFGVEDYRREGTDFLMTCTRISREKGMPFAAFSAQKAKEFQKEYSTEAVVFNLRKGQPARAVSDTVHLTRGGAVATTVYGRWILVDTPGDNAVLITCKIMSSSDLKAYEEAIEAIAATIEPCGHHSPPPASKPAK